jgi:hypothetical protein
VTDLKAMGKVGHITDSVQARANAAVDALISNPHAKSSTKPDLKQLKISVYPGSSRPLRAKLSPTSIAFWKKLDSAGVDLKP